jgi:hypothetical protein
MAQIGPPMTPSMLLAQQLQAASRRSGSEALREFAAQLAASSAGAPPSAASATTSTVVAQPIQAIAPVAAVTRDDEAPLRRPGSVLDIRV